MTSTQLTVEIADWEWQSLQIWSEEREVVGHKIKMGSVIELQLLLEPRLVLRYWVRRPSEERQWVIDPQYDARLVLGLGPGSEPVGRVIQPLRPGTNLAYFEGRVQHITRMNSNLDQKIEIVHSLIDCGFPIVLEAEIRKDAPLPIVSSEGEEILGICRLFGTITVSNTLFRAPLKAKVISARLLETHPPNVLLTIEPTSNDAEAQHRLFYSWLDKKV